MKIPCFFKSGFYEAAYVAAVLECKNPFLRETLEFLVDTGASRTTILDKDAAKLKLNHKKLEKLDEGMLGIGGAVDTYVLEDAKLTFLTEDGSGHTENLQRIYVLKHAHLDERTMRIPSILGRDILNKHTLVYDKCHENAYIADEPSR